MPKHLKSRNSRSRLVTAGGDRDRGEIRELPPGVCPFCGKDTSITAGGRRRRHLARGLGSDDCRGSGIIVREAEVELDLANLPPIRIRKGARPLEPLQPRPYREPPLACPDCGLRVPGRRRNDGQIRRHRVELDNPFAPWCVPEENR